MHEPRVSIAPFISELIVVLFFLPFIVLPFLSCPGSALGQSLDASSSEAEDSITTPPKSFVLHYTGALFGYFRIEPGSPIRTLAPVAEFFHQQLAPDTAERASADLLGHVALTSQDQRLLAQAPLLVGMGDNFGPEFGAALQMNEFKNEPGCNKEFKTNGTPESQELPQAAYKSDSRVVDQKHVYCDNVTRFLMAAGYRAVVPGREDFLYSATWLRSIALGLRWASDQKDHSPFLIGNSEGRLAMLAANLRVIGAPKGKESKDPQAHPPCPLLFAQQGVPPTPCTTDLIPTTAAMDWLNRLDLSLDPSTGVEKKLCVETSLALNYGFRSGLQDAKPLPCNLTADDWPALLRRLPQACQSGQWENEATMLKSCVLAGISPHAQLYDIGPLSYTPNIHEASPLQLRRTLMENQALQMLSMIDGVDDDALQAATVPVREIREALTALAKDSAYLLNEHQKAAGLSLNPASEATAGVEAANQLHAKLATLRCGGTDKSLNDLCLFGTELGKKLDGMQKDDSLLFDEATREAGRRLLLRAIAKEQKDAGYTISRHQKSNAGATAMTGTLIVGVVGQKTMEAVSPTNLDVASPKKLQTAQTEDLAAGTIKGQVNTLDPLRTLIAVLRGAMQMAEDTCAPDKTVDRCEMFDRVLVMAQMPRPEAEELGAQLRVSLTDATRQEKNRPILNPRLPILILSEAQADYSSLDLTFSYTNGKLIPVLTPDPPYDRSGSLWAPVSEASFRFASTTNKKQIAATLQNLPPSKLAVSSEGSKSTLHLLLNRMKDLGIAYPESCVNFAKSSLSPQSASSPETVCKHDLNAQLLGALRNGEGAVVRGDVVMLEQRDIYYGNLPQDYTRYEACPDEPQSEPFKKCALRVALDRVLWKGDYSERVMITGSDLVAMMTTSQQQELGESSLSATDVSGQSLATFGIVQPSSPNLSRPGSGNDEFPLLQDNVCGHEKTAVTDPSAYCVDGQPIRGDGAYWAITSDHLANDGLIYKVMKASKKDSYHQAEKYDYLTGSIAKALLGPVRAPFVPAEPPEARTAEWDQQLGKVVHLDIGKLVTGFSARKPQGGNVYAEQFQGAADTRSSTPSQQEIDLESLTRISWDIPVVQKSGWLRTQPLTSSLGVQTDAEYDRAATGNLTNKPTTVTYALNSFTIGPFLQFRLPQWRGPHGTWTVDAGRALPRTLVVLSPVQYQRQFTGNYIVFPFSQTPPPTTPPTVSGQFTVHVPEVTSLFEKVGLRHEYAGKYWFEPESGSYIETGFEFGVQNSILSSVALTSDGITPPPCTAKSSITIAGCFSGYANSKSPTYVKGFQIDQTTALAVPLATETLHATGGYWDIHFQKALMRAGAGASANAGPASSAKRGINFTLDTKADWFSKRNAEKSLNTQTRYAVPLSMALNFPVLRNVSLSPTYSAFFFSSQVTGQSIVINTFSVQAKWYFARDATVPPPRQIYFRGPSSADQTATAKIK